MKVQNIHTKEIFAVTKKRTITADLQTIYTLQADNGGQESQISASQLEIDFVTVFPGITDFVDISALPPDKIKTQYKYIHFVQLPHNGTTTKWSCRNINSGDELGIIKWHGAWRQYCYFSTDRAVYSKGCLQDISEFISALNIERSKQ